MHLTEGRNTGFRKILNALEKNGSPKPIFETDPARLSFSSTLLIHPAFVGENVGESVGENVGVKLNKTQRKIIDLLRENPRYTLEQMAQIVTVERRTIERNVKKLREKDVLGRIGSDREGYWVVKG